MGSATYYMKADNCTQEAYEQIRNLFVEGIKAQKWWQGHREWERNKSPEMNRDAFWSVFGEKFPIVSKYLKSINLYGGDCNNKLAGYLDFGSYEDEVEDNMILYDDEIRYDAYVWHFANWKGIMKFIMDEYKVDNARYISDEYMNPYDSI